MPLQSNHLARGSSLQQKNHSTCATDLDKGGSHRITCTDQLFFSFGTQGRTSAPPVRQVDSLGNSLGRADMREQLRIKTASAGGRQKTLNYLDKNRKNRRISDVSGWLEIDSNSLNS